MQRGSLKTAGGYLLILHTFEELSSSSEQLVRLLSRAKDEEDWELCKELARFLTALDETGDTLVEALDFVNLRSPKDERVANSFMFEGSRLKVPIPKKSRSMNGGHGSDQDEKSSNSSLSPTSVGGGRVEADYFSRQDDGQ